MRINPLLVGFGVAVLLNSSPLYAADCSISFDQSCLSQGESRATVEKAYEQSPERIDQVNKGIEACKEAIAERRQTQLMQNQLDTELALNDIIANNARGDYRAPHHELDDVMSFGDRLDLDKAYAQSVSAIESANVHRQSLLNQKMIEAKSAEDSAACSVEK